jgi:hypothetical protein
MSDDTRLYISVESSAGHLVVDGPLLLWRELVGTLGTSPAESAPVAEQQTATAPVEATR